MTASPAAPTGRPGSSPRRPIRVVYSIDTMRTGGTELNAVRTAERIDRQRFAISVVCIGDPEGPLRARYEAIGVQVVPFPIASLYAPSTGRQLLRLASYLRAERADIVHSHDVYSSIFTTAAGRVAGVPTVISSRRFLVSPNRSRQLVAVSRVTYRMSHRVLTNSSAVGRHLVAAEGVPADRVFVLPNFVDDEFFDPITGSDRARMRAELGVPAGATLVGVVARLEAIKDHETLLRALARLAPGRPTLHLALVGEGSRRAALEALAASLGVADRVHFTGLRPHSPNLHHLFDLSALTSTSEGFPNSVVEAMAARRAVVATAVGGNVDAVDDGVTGLLAPSGDDAAIAERLARLVDDPSLRERMGDAGLERAQREFRASRVMAMLEETYERLATARR